MPSKTKQQQRFFYAVQNCKKGGKCTPELELVADKMSDTGIEHFTHLKPKKKKIKEHDMSKFGIYLGESEAHKEEEEGYEAGFDGKPKSSCPYEKGSEFYKAWMEGYTNAKEDKSTELGKGVKESLDEKVNYKSITIEKADGEYRVPAEDGYEDGAYYTNDKLDAMSVAQKVFGKDVIIKFRSVPEFVGGKYEKMKPKNEGYEPDAKQLDKANKNLDSKYEKGNKDAGYTKCPKCSKKMDGDECGCGYKKMKESLDEAKSPEEKEAFDKAEKEVADKMGLTLPLPKDTDRATRDKFYAQVQTKLKKKSNVGKTLDKLKQSVGHTEYCDNPKCRGNCKKLKEDTVKHDKRVGRIIKAQKALGDEKYSTTEIGWMSDKERKDVLDRLETKIEAEKKKGNLKDYVLSHLE